MSPRGGSGSCREGFVCLPGDSRGNRARGRNGELAVKKEAGDARRSTPSGAWHARLPTAHDEGRPLSYSRQSEIPTLTMRRRRRLSSCAEIGSSDSVSFRRAPRKVNIMVYGTISRYMIAEL